MQDFLPPRLVHKTLRKVFGVNCQGCLAYRTIYRTNSRWFARSITNLVLWRLANLARQSMMSMSEQVDATPALDVSAPEIYIASGWTAEGEETSPSQYMATDQEKLKDKADEASDLLRRIHKVIK